MICEGHFCNPGDGLQAQTRFVPMRERQAKQFIMVPLRAAAPNSRQYFQWQQTTLCDCSGLVCVCCHSCTSSLKSLTKRLPFRQNQFGCSFWLVSTSAAKASGVHAPFRKHQTGLLVKFCKSFRRTTYSIKLATRAIESFLCQGLAF